jgi:cephalosporin hydroxylase
MAIEAQGRSGGDGARRLSGLRQVKRLARRVVAPPARALPPAFPPPLEGAEAGSLLAYRRARLVQHTHDFYAGAPIQKFPEDLRVYEHLLWASRCNVVVELGTNAGGSTLWFRDRLETMAHYGRVRNPRVIAVDIVPAETEHGVRRVDPDARHIVFVDGDVTDDALPARIDELVRPGDRVFVIEDSAHTYETTMASLRGFSRFTPFDGWFVVEDTVVDVEELRIDDRWPHGVAPAVHDWLLTDQGRQFEVDPSVELYGVTCHPGGFLRRRATI